MSGSASSGRETVLVTGSSGRIGTYLRARLRKPGRTLRLLDLQPTGDAHTTSAAGPTGHAEADEIVTGSVTDPSAMTEAMPGVTAVVHLAGIANSRAAWTDLLHANIQGTTTVFEAARLRRVPRVVFASSNHAAGLGTHQSLNADIPPRSDSFYGVTKVFGEALGSLYHDVHGMEVICLRIGSCTDRPRNTRMLSTWLSPDDTGRLVEAALSHPDPGFTIVWGVSNNHRRIWPLEPGYELGYVPEDDAEPYAAELGVDPAR